MNSMPLFLTVLMEKLNAKERSALVSAAALTKAEVGASQKLEAAAKKLEKELKSPKLQKASQLYQVLMKAPGELVLYLLVYSEQRLVQDRIRNYFQKYLPASLEITDEMVVAAHAGVAPGTPKFHARKEEMILHAPGCAAEEACAGTGASTATADVEFRAWSGAAGSAVR